MTLQEMKKEHARLGKLIREAEEGRFLKHEFIQAELLTVKLPDEEITSYRVKLYAQHTWRTIFYADDARQAVADLESLRDAIGHFIDEFCWWVEEKEGKRCKET